VRKADNLTTLMCRLSRNPGALTSRTPQGHVGLFRGYFLVVLMIFKYYLVRHTFAQQHNLSISLLVYDIKIRVQMEKLRENSVFMSLIVRVKDPCKCKNKASYLTRAVRDCVNPRVRTCKYIWIRSRTRV
jgi:hypothetical protein